MAKGFLLYITAKDPEMAEMLASNLLDAGLIACANIFPAITSLYRWEGKLARESEAVLIAKTSAERAEAAIAMATKSHPYACPCVVAVPLEAGNPDFLEWLWQETRPHSGE